MFAWFNYELNAQVSSSKKFLLHFFHNKYGREWKERSSLIDYFMYF